MVLKGEKADAGLGTDDIGLGTAKCDIYVVNEDVDSSLRLEIPSVEGDSRPK